jgi:hypothetical protein
MQNIDLIGGTPDEQNDYISSYNYFIYYNSIRPRDPRLPIPKWKPHNNFDILKEQQNKIPELEEHDHTVDLGNGDQNEDNNLINFMGGLDLNSGPTIPSVSNEINNSSNNMLRNNNNNTGGGAFGYGANKGFFSQEPSYGSSQNTKNMYPSDMYAMMNNKEQNSNQNFMGNSSFDMGYNNNMYNNMYNNPNMNNYYPNNDDHMMNYNSMSNYMGNQGISGFSNMPQNQQMYPPQNNFYEQYQQMLMSNSMRMNPNFMTSNQVHGQGHMHGGYRGNNLPHTMLNQANPQGQFQKKANNFKSDKGNWKDKGFEATNINDLLPNIIEFCKDHSGSRLVQKRFEEGSEEEREKIFSKIENEIMPLSKDVFGNYVIQKVLDYAEPEHKQLIIKKLKGKIHELAMHMYGCRVIQKAVDIADEEDILDYLNELSDYITKSIEDQNGNHVIQKLIERLPKGSHGKILRAIKGKVFDLSVHQYGCRVIQRIFEYCKEQE